MQHFLVKKKSSTKKKKKRQNSPENLCSLSFHKLPIPQAMAKLPSPVFRSLSLPFPHARASFEAPI
jgi:hypothetical protein